MAHHPDELPEALETELIAILDGSSELLTRKLDELCDREPEHAARLRAWADRARVPGAEHVVASSTEERLARLKARAPLDRSRYRIEGEVGEGGMGAVLRVRDEDLGRPLAMKVILGHSPGTVGSDTPAVDRQLLERFLDEAQITGQLDHPGVVPVHELGLDQDGKVFFTMRLVRGHTADEVFALARDEKDGWTRTRALDVILKVCDTMAFAHAKGVLHRDLKPANIMVGRFGEVYVMDWGLAKVIGQEDHRDLRIRPAAGSELSKVRTDRARVLESDPDSSLVTMDGAVIGTPSYMPPEQAEGRIEDLGPRTDVYAVGGMLYQLLTGWRPYVKPGARLSPYTVLRAVMDGPPKPVQAIDRTAPAELVAICERAMARDTAARYPDMAALAADVRAYLDQRVVRAYRTGALAETAAWFRRNKGVAAALAAVVLASVAGAVAFWWKAEEADGQRRDAQMLGLVNASASSQAEHPMRALLLARQATRMRQDRRAMQRLRDAVGACYQRAVLRGHAGEVRSAVFSPTGDRILTASDDKTARLWDLEGNQIAVLSGHEYEYGLRAGFSPDGDLIVTSSDQSTRLWDLGGDPVAEMRGANPSFSPARDRIVTSSWTNVVRLWDLRGRPLSHVILGHGTNSAVFGTSGDRVLIASSDGTAAISDLRGEPVATAPGETQAPLIVGKTVTELIGHEGAVRSAIYSPAGDRILTVSDDKTVRLWDLDGDQLAVLSGHRLDVMCAAFSPAGDRIVTASEDKTARLWDLRGEQLAVLAGHGASVTAAAFSPIGDRIVTSSYDESARIWNLQGEQLAVLSGHEQAVTSAAFAPNGKHVLTASEDGTARLWDLQIEGIPVLHGHEGGALSATFSPTGDRILTVSANTARVWDPRGNQLAVLRGDEDEVWDASFSPAGDCILTLSETARIWDLRGEVLAVLDEHGGEVDSAVFSPAGDRVLTISANNTARLWDLQGEQLAELRGLNSEVYFPFPTFSPAGDRILTPCHDNAVRLWDLQGNQLAVLRGHEGAVLVTAFSPAGDRILTASIDDTARLWGPQGELVAVLDGHEGGIACAAFAPAGDRVLTASEDKTVRLWDRDGDQLAVLRGHQDWIWTAVFSPDGDRVLTASDDRTARLWDLERNEVAVLRGHEKEIWGASFSPAGDRILTYSDDETARLWDLQGEQLAVLRGHGLGIDSAVFSPTGDRVLTASADETARLWLVRDDDVLRLADARIGTEVLSDEERGRFAELIEDERFPR